MFSLDIPTEPYWLDLTDGVRVKVRPLGAAVLSAATSYAQRIVREMLAEHADRLAMNMPVTDLPDITDADVRRGLIDQHLAIGLARFGVVEWSGVGMGVGDKAAPCTPENIARFAAMAIGLDFLKGYQMPIQAVAAEGNASAPTQPIGGDVGAITAPVASRNAKRALALSPRPTARKVPPSGALQ